MRGIKRIAFLLVGLVLLVGCASTRSIPTPRAGLVLLVNENQGAFAYCRLFQGIVPQSKVIVVNQNTGLPKWGEKSIMQFKIDSAYARDFLTTKSLVLPPQAREYTLSIIWTRFTGQVLDINTIYFNTTGNPFQEYHVDGLGRKRFADRIIYLPQVQTSTARGIRIHKTLYTGDWIKALIGLP